jgi:molecular chaperone GrpE
VKKEKDQGFNRYREEEAQEAEDAKTNKSNATNGAPSEDANEKEEPVVEEISKEKVLENQVAQLKDQLLRSLAELENFKRRNNEERIKERKYASQQVFTELVEAMDAFEVAFKIETEDETLKTFLKGFELVREKLKTLLENNGVKKIEAVGKPFDPNFHMAVTKIKVEGKDSGIVLEELMPGYLYKDRVLRPSMVIVNE